MFLTTSQSIEEVAKWHNNDIFNSLKYKKKNKKKQKRIEPFTKEVVENTFTQCSVNLHKVCKAIKIFPTWDPIRQLRMLGCLAWIVDSHERTL